MSFPRFRRWLPRAEILFGLMVCAVAGVPVLGVSAESAWTEGILARARIVAASIEPGAHSALIGLEIVLPPNAKTYWQWPGRDGYAPVLDWRRSINVQSPEVSWPTPRRFPSDPGLPELIGYKGGMLVLAQVKPIDPMKPIKLVIELELGVCEDVCVPDYLQLELTLTSENGPSMHDAALRRAVLQMPATNGTSGLEVKQARRLADGSIEIRARSNGPNAPEVFIEAASADCDSQVTPFGRQGGSWIFLVAGTCAAGREIRLLLAEEDRAIRAVVAIW